METILGRSDCGRGGAAGTGAADGAGRSANGAAIRGAAGLSTGFAFGFGAAFASLSLDFTGDGRDFKPRRCALPITALRLTPPRSSAIWLAVRPFSHIVFSRSIRSSVQAMVAPNKVRCGANYHAPLKAACRTKGKAVVECAMTIQHKSNAAPVPVQDVAPMPPRDFVIKNVNWIGLKTLYLKEVRRFMKVQLQTIWAPSITTLLFLVIFTVALGRGGVKVLGVPFPDFIAPGLIVMGMMQNAFANSSFSLLVGKIQGTIVDYLMPPLSNAELLAAMVAGAVTRAFAVGFVIWGVMLLWPGVHVAPAHPLIVLWFGLLGSTMVALLGVLTSIWAEKFDHAAVVSNFVIGPLSLLSGTFYTIDRLAPVFQTISHANPFFFVISGFRYGFIDRADSSIVLGSAVLLGLNILLTLAAYFLLRSGWKLKN
jgi:ABC-2 type transport system permease protein